MNIFGLTAITVLGAVMALIGATGLVYYIIRYRRLRAQFRENGQRDPGTPPSTFATFWVVNGFLHLGMLLLILGGAGLIFYGQR